MAQPSGYAFTRIATLGGNPFLSYFEPAAVNSRGDVLFAPDLATGGEGVYLWRRGLMTAIAEGGQPLPGGGTMGYTLSPVAMNDSGQIAFIATRDGTDFPPSPLGINAGVYRYDPLRGVTAVMVPGGEFLGAYFRAGINNLGNIVFPGMICADASTSFNSLPSTACASNLVTFAVYKADAHGTVTTVVKPGDAAPGGRQFDAAYLPWINDAGDVVFAAHLWGDVGPLADSVYVKRFATGRIETVAHAGDSSPVVGRTYAVAFGAVLDAAGNVAFMGGLSGGGETAVFLYSAGKTIAIAQPGDPMPGGGIFRTTGNYNQNVYMNKVGDIVFTGTLDNGDQGVYLWRKGRLSLVAKTGTDTGFGTISTMDEYFSGIANIQVALNEARQILFSAQFAEGGGALILATPR